MKTNYFTKVENKYVFNVSLIFWHMFIALSSLAIMVFIVVFLWSIFPTSERKVEKQAYPEKTAYPEPIKVSLSELSFETKIQEEVLTPPSENLKEEKKTDRSEYVDLQGKPEYDLSLSTLKVLIPPAKYSWSGSGYFTYPYGERYWIVYKQERYRQWNITEYGIEEKLSYSYKTSKAKSYSEKKQILDGFISVVKLLPEKNRISALQYLINNVADNISQNTTTCQALVNIVSKMSKEENLKYLDQLAGFAKDNPNDGSLLIGYLSTIIDKFDVLQRNRIIVDLSNSYYNYFGQNFAKQKEATDLFIPMLPKIKGENHPRALMQYYGLYVTKNSQRDIAIAQIENEYQHKISEIDNNFEMEQANAIYEYQRKKLSKQEYRLKSLAGIGSGILLIVFIAMILVFLSIQRSVSKIEEKITNQYNS
jgi:hypothetical protein